MSVTDQQPTNREQREAAVRNSRREVRLCVPISRAQVNHRDASDGQAASLELTGYASVFDSDSQVMGFWEPFVEQVKRGAFRKALANGPDVRFLYNHDGLTLARTTNGTVELKEDPRGLYFRAELNPDMQAARDVYAGVQRGDLDQMSFAFTVEQEAWDYSGDIDRRDIVEVGDLLDISVVSYPAYEAASVETNSSGRVGEAATLSDGELPVAGQAGEQRDQDGPVESPAPSVSRRARVLALLCESTGEPKWSPTA